MKVTSIFKVLNLAEKARKINKPFVPLFAGDAGIGKSQVCQQWAKSKDFKFIDVRIAYMEAPDFIGLQFIVDGKAKFATPEMWPTTGKGLLLFEEPNRGNIAMRNCLMQILTDREVNGVKIGDDWIMAACINPENEHYEVDTMDVALKDRFVIYDVEYDKDIFVSYMEENRFAPEIINFVKSDSWVYKRPEDLSKTTDAKYVAPRTFSALDSAYKCGVKDDIDLHFFTSLAILGKNVGTAFHSFVYNERPVMVADLLKSKKKALERLECYSDPRNLRNDLLSVTVDDILQKYAEVNEDLFAEVLLTIPQDLSFNLMKQMFLKLAQDSLTKKKGNNSIHSSQEEIDESNLIIESFFSKYKDVKAKFKASLSLNKR